MREHKYDLNVSQQYINWVSSLEVPKNCKKYLPPQRLANKGYNKRIPRMDYKSSETLYFLMGLQRETLEELVLEVSY